MVSRTIIPKYFSNLGWLFISFLYSLYTTDESEKHDALEHT